MRNDYQIPFDQLGNQLHYEHEYVRGSKVWRNNDPFWATMRLTGMCSGRSAKYLIAEDEHGHHYTMFVSDLLSALQRVGAQPGGVIGPCLWGFRKRGQNFGLEVVDAPASR